MGPNEAPILLKMSTHDHENETITISKQGSLQVRDGPGCAPVAPQGTHNKSTAGLIACFLYIPYVCYVPYPMPTSHEECFSNNSIMRERCAEGLQGTKPCGHGGRDTHYLPCSCRG
jgi:hypothetical protein